MATGYLGRPAPLASEWFRLPSPVSDPATRLLCFPHAGGAAGFFRSWHQRVAPGIEVHAVRYPGREDRLREPCLDRMEPLVEAITVAAESLLDRPLAFFGHSMGASVAHEVALRLERRHGFTVDRLFVSARPAPRLLRPFDYSRMASDDSLVDDLRRLGSRGSALLDNPDFREVLLPAIRADYWLVAGYRPDTTERVSSPIVAYAGDSDPEVSVTEVAGWREANPADFTLRTFSGDHFYLVEREADLIADISAHLTAARRRESLS
jgi:pyochelin biosynthetic protein PchC